MISELSLTMNTVLRFLSNGNSRRVTVGRGSPYSLDAGTMLSAAGAFSAVTFSCGSSTVKVVCALGVLSTLISPCMRTTMLWQIARRRSP